MTAECDFFGSPLLFFVSCPRVSFVPLVGERVSEWVSEAMKDWRLGLAWSCVVGVSTLMTSRAETNEPPDDNILQLTRQPPPPPPLPSFPPFPHSSSLRRRWWAPSYRVILRICYSIPFSRLPSFLSSFFSFLSDFWEPLVSTYRSSTATPMLHRSLRRRRRRRHRHRSYKKYSPLLRYCNVSYCTQLVRSLVRPSRLHQKLVIGRPCHNCHPS